MVHQHLKLVFSFDAGGCQQILNQFEHTDDMPLLGLGKFSNQKDRRSQQSFRRVIEERILSVGGGITAGGDDGLCCNLRILLRLGFAGKV